jgi:subtilisin family serine protease
MKLGSVHLLILIAFYFGGAQAAELSTVRLKDRTFTPQPGFSALDESPDLPGARRFLVQLGRKPDAQLRAQLEACGVHLVRYIPKNTWIATFTAAARIDPQVRRRLRWVGKLTAEDKMPARLARGEIGPWAVEPDGRVRVRIRFHDDVDVASAEAQLRALGVEPTARLAVLPGVTATVAEPQIRLIAGLDPVLWVDEDLPPPLTENDGTRAAIRVNSLQSAPYGLSGAGINVGITDGGHVDDTHDDFAGRIVIVDGSSALSYHATHVAGTLAGSGVLSTTHGGTYLQWRGMAPAAQLYSWDFVGDVTAEIAAGIQTYDLDVDNDSWGLGVNGTNCYLYGDYEELSAEFDALVAGAAGKPISIVFSAGNERDDGDCPLLGDGYGCLNPPKAAKNLLVVGATYSDTDGMTDFSSWGPCDDGRLKPDVTAPGCEEGGEGYIHSTLPVDDYGGPLYCGTSMAAPAATGTLALLYELYFETYGETPPPPSLMRALLISTAKDLGNVGPDYAFGAGRIDAKAAADVLLCDSPYVFTVADSSVQEFPFEVPTDAGALRVVLDWDDPDAAPNANPALINDLDLVLIDPDQTEHFPWVLDPAQPWLPAATGVDTLNNVEHVQVDDPIPGSWIARVTGTNVPTGEQIASLVGLDQNPPSVPGNFDARNPTATTIELRWVPAPQADREGTLIVSSQDPITWTPVTGMRYRVGSILQQGVHVVFSGKVAFSSGSVIDSLLTPGTKYYYAARSFDDMLNYSEAATDSATTMAAASIERTASAEPPVRLVLGAAHPNPADGSTTIDFAVPQPERVAVRIFDPSGRLVRTLVDEEVGAGDYRVAWDGRDEARRRVAAGVYFYELRAGGQRIARRLSWVR